ncbi:MAG: hypothetical protein L0Y74_04575, partial [candidate division Zixibacteria bacterium]|nr:hypothetical protein [candidate division Zixibacteria bacterium]
NFGVEYSYRQQYFARLGYKGSSQNQNDFSFGLGVNYRSYTIDYALVPFKSGLGQSHQVALIIGL